MNEFKRVQSICPDCGRPVPAEYIREGGAVYLERVCPAHGNSRVLASEDADVFEKWLTFPSVTVPPRVFITKGASYRNKERDEVKDREKGASFPDKKYDDRKDERDVVIPGVTIENGAGEGGTGYGGAGGSEHGSENMATECPLHCGVCEDHLMTACCVLLNVTDRCNQHCPYCFAEAGECATQGDTEEPSLCVPQGAQGDTKEPSLCVPVIAPDPALADIERWLDRLIELGEERKFNIQLSGGEPTVREDLPDIIRMCKAKGFEYVQLNTNGRRLAGDPAYAKTLKEAGLSTVFLQFDGISDDVYIALRGEPLLAIKQAAIRNCGAAGLPVTLVPTVLKSANLVQIGAILEFMLKNITVVKGVHFQPASFFGRRPDERNADGDFDERVTMFAVMEEIEKQTGGSIKKTDLAPISTGHPLCCFCGTFMKERDGSVYSLSSGGSCCGTEGGASDNSGCCEDGSAGIASCRDSTGGASDNISCCGDVGAGAASCCDSTGGASYNSGCCGDVGAGTASCCGTEGGASDNTGCCEDVDADTASCYVPIGSASSCCGPAIDPLEIIRRDRDFVLNKWDINVPEDDAEGDRFATQNDTPDDSTALSFDEAIAMFKNNMFTVSGMAFMDETNLDAERLRRCRVQVFSPDERLVPFCGYYTVHADGMRSQL